MNRPICYLCTLVIITVLFFYRWNPWTPKALPEEADTGQNNLVTGFVTDKEYSGQEVILQCRTALNLTYRIKLEENPPIIPYIGETIQVCGILREYESATNPGQFDVRKYYAIHGIDAYMNEAVIMGRNGEKQYLKELLCHIRHHLEGVLECILPEQEAGAMKAILLGIKSDMCVEQKSLYQRSGTAHILAISGLHITFIGMGLYRLLRRLRLSQAICIPVCILLMLLYGEMTGMSNSAFRAIVMFSMKLLAILLKRTYDMPTGIAVSAMLILFEQPLYVYDSGFLLSFGAVMGVACINPMYGNHLESISLINMG